MRLHSWFGHLQQWLGSLGAGSPGGEGAPGFGGAATLRGLSGRNPEIADLQEEVAAEQQGRVALVSRCGELNRWLLAALREQAQLESAATLQQEGFFTLATLPGEPAPLPGDDDLAPGLPTNWVQEEILSAITGMDLILVIFDAGAGWQGDDDRWFARLRALGAPLLPVAIEDGAITGNGGDGDALRHHLGVMPATIARTLPPAGDAAEPLRDLVERMLALRPRLAIPLAQEVPACRELIARRVIRTGALMAMLVGAEPFPLLDLPLTVLVQWKMALQLAAIHGRPGLDVLSQEMASTVGLNLIVRLAAQQAFKLVPVVGWVLSATLNFASTWLLGQALLSRYVEDEHRRLRAMLARPRQAFARLGGVIGAARLRPRLRRFRLRRRPAPLPATASASAEGAQDAMGGDKASTVTSTITNGTVGNQVDGIPALRVSLPYDGEAGHG